MMRYFISYSVLWGSARSVEIEPLSEHTTRIRSHECAHAAAGAVQEIEDHGWGPSNPIKARWESYVAALRSGNLDAIELHYAEMSLVHLYNSSAGVQSEVRGLAQIRNFFGGSAIALSSFNVLDLDVDENLSQVFVVWDFPGQGMRADTFVFGKNFKISRQNVVLWRAVSSPRSVKAVWDNHWAAVGGQNLVRIMLDYDASSLVRVYDSVAGGMSEFRGSAQIRKFVAGFLAPSNSSDTSTFKMLELAVDESPRQVFFVWESPGQGISTVSETFVIGEDFKIKRQNVVVTRIA